MKNKRLYKILKITGSVGLVLLAVVIMLFYSFSAPQSDAEIKKEFAENEVFIEHRLFETFNYRVLTTQKQIDTTLPTLVFVHGAIGSAIDFKEFMQDKELSTKANLISYDRIGYGVDQTGAVQASIAFEVEVLRDVTKHFKKENTILVGYSYGGPIALASKEKYKKVVLLAPAVYSEVEQMPWALNLYKWNATRWLVPDTWRAASKEKLSHKNDLQKFENNWNTTKSKIISIHGKSDWIVPYENSLYLKEQFDSNQFDLVTLEGAGHGLVWTHFKEIKNVLLQQLN